MNWKIVCRNNLQLFPKHVADKPLSDADQRRHKICHS